VQVVEEAADASTGGADVLSAGVEGGVRDANVVHLFLAL
jgi:hypothetical protein